MRFSKKSSLQKNPGNNEKVLTNDLKENIEKIKEYLCRTEDLMLKEININNRKSAFLYLESLVKKELILSFIIEPMLEENKGEIENVIKATEEKNTSQVSTLGNSLLDGFCLILKENCSDGILVATADSQGRSITEPVNEQNIKGARDGFVESLSANIQLIRKRVKTPQLKIKYFNVGNITNTKVGMVYIDSLANRKLVEEVEKRITCIQLDQLQSSGSLDELIEDNPFTPFPQILNTERPDRAASYLAEGKINLIVDGSPIVSVVPITFFSLYQASDDYNSRWLIGSFFRIIRIISFIITISLPAIYIAIVSFHSEVLPIGILYSIRVSLEFVPFPPLIEALAMQIILELLKEAAIRLPSPIAQTIGIVGGLVIGTAVVEAHLVSNTMIVVIGFTAIASFVAPINEMGTSARLLGFPTMLAASVLGFFGIVLTLMFIFMHLSKLESFGTPYFSPLAPFKREDLKDTFIRLPVWKFNTRPTNASPRKSVQQGFSRVWKKK
ncbi:spore germination protein [Bacillus bombysepticus]|uniref:Spore germination protein n=1 Tax=Bacillus thuringiensis serovar kumamotoensis TaxID=132267 RepID=A0A9X6JRB7_BACUK|nr:MULTISPECIES: spore germination protein [Bacillus cereus group]MEC2867318.1 spore germination protein [Bacillus cereus]OTZ75885.1 spore germination protein [Bacillus thuringiensis serovar kumamtoensis]